MGSSTRRARTVALDQITVADAANLYLDHLHARARAGQVGWGHYRSCRQHLVCALEVLRRDRPLAEVGKGEIQAAVLHFASRPPGRPRLFQRAPAGRPIAAATAKGRITVMKAMFVWLAEHDLLTWERPRGFERLFRLKDRRLQTPEEAARACGAVVSGEVDSFTPQELTRIFRAGRPRDRLYILLGLNCGLTSSEISSLRTFEVSLDAERPFIHRRRGKTGVEARWCLWPETAALLRGQRARANAGRYWLLTEAGNPLVEVDDRCRRDAVDQAWKSLWPRTGMTRWLGFRFLRKTGAGAVKRLGGLEESEMYLSHQEPGLNKHYANRNWERMWSCLERYRAELPFLGAAWELDPCECLFTQDAASPDWSEANPPWVQRVTKRSRSGLLNVSLHAKKGKYYGRIYRRGRTYCTGYFDRPDDAAAAAREIRRQLDSGVDPQGRKAGTEGDRPLTPPGARDRPHR